MSRKPILFISYSHLDEPESPGEGEVRWLSFVVGHLRPAEKHGAVEIWLDRMMEGGADWSQEIERKLRACDVFILLVSNNAMASSYIVDKEIAIVRERQANGEDVPFYPLLLTPTTKIALDQVRDKNLRPRDGQPFSKFPLYERHEKMCEAADEIVEIAGRVLSDIKLSARLGRPQPVVADRSSLDTWFKRQGHKRGLIIAVRAALRAAPVLALSLGDWHNSSDVAGLSRLMGAAFRTGAVAWVVGMYPKRVNELRGAIVSAAHEADVAYAAVQDQAAEAAAAADSFAALATAAGGGSASRFAATALHATEASIAAIDAASNTRNSAKSWSEVGADITNADSGGVRSLTALPLWSQEWPDGFWVHWDVVRTALPVDSDWDVWFRWYQNRLDGVSRGEDYELVFATVPLKTWEQGPAAANAWIKAHLPKEPDAPPALPPPLPDLDSPFTYAWTAALRVAAVAGPQNLPFYPFFDSEEHHRRALEACRKGAERLLKGLREGSRYNVRPEYAEALRYYLKDLPKAAGEGNILLANDQAVNLREMFAQDRESLPGPVAAQLRRVIENQFALNAFYDLVKKHQDAIAASELTLPFPAEAARRFFGVVEAETPRFFEPPVGEGLRDVERAAPPVALAPDETRPSTAIQPPPLPPGTPDPRQSHERQIATAANALWETFLKGKDLPVAIEAWTEAVQKLGHAVGPLLDFLRGLGS